MVRAIVAKSAATAGQLAKATGLGRSTVSATLTELRYAGILLGLAEIRLVICDLTHSVLSDDWIAMPDNSPPDGTVMGAVALALHQHGKIA